MWIESHLYQQAREKRNIKEKKDPATKFVECKFSKINHFPLQSLMHYKDLCKIFSKMISVY